MLFLALNLTAGAQGPASPDQFISLPGKFFSKVNSKVNQLNDQLSKQTEKYLRRLQKREQKLLLKISRLDSAKAKQLFATTHGDYDNFIGKMKSPDINAGSLNGEYLPYLDSLKGSLSFIEKNAGLLNGAKDISKKANESLANLQQFQSRLHQAEKIKDFIRQRKQQLKETLGRYTKLHANLSKQFHGFNKEIYYYSRQVREYREVLSDPDKMTKKALSLLNRLPAFQEFVKQHSQLAGLFALPGGYGNVANLGGLQTRVQVQSMVQTQIASAGPNGPQILQQNLQAAQAKLNEFKDRLKQRGSGDMEMPDFKPNTQRTKNFLQRIEIGTNLQSTKSNYFFPTTTDLGLSVGYKLSDRSIIGIGGSYKVGWGKDIKNIVVTSQGAGLRSFLDIKLKGSYYASGGFEYNYQPVDSVNSTGKIEWTQSGLVGISKIVSLKTKFFKKTKLQLLWDFLSYEQLPRTQPIKFRVGYNF